MALKNLLLLVLFTYLHYILVSGNMLETYYYNQRLDHLESDPGLSQVTFTQRFYIDRSYWSTAEGPILVYFGGEAPLNEEDVSSLGLITESAPILGALIIYIEHRFYGLSVPYGSIDRAISDPKVRGCFTTSQALEDFHEIISGVKRNESAELSPVIVIGGSYAGTLATMFRLRRPTSTVGALASSAPMYFDFQHSKNFYTVTSRAYQEINHDCHDKIRQSWKLLDDKAKLPGGLEYISKIFDTCKSLASIEDFKSFLVRFYTFTAQHDDRFSEGITSFCDKLVDPSNTNLLEGIARGINSAFTITPPCLNINEWFRRDLVSADHNVTEAWSWQICNELIIPFSSEQETMFPVQTFNFTYFLANCEAVYGVELHPWAIKKNDVSTIFEGTSSNIIFSNGLRDPYSSVGVLEDISDTIVAVNTKKGSHCMDLLPIRADDPYWLLEQRREIIKIFKKWLEPDPNLNSSSSLITLKLHIFLALYLLVVLVCF